MIDLHVHTNMSDGSFSPAEVVRFSAQKGLQAIAITDHDTIAGIGEARAEGSRSGVEVISGVEMSVEWNPGIVHILGFFVRLHDRDLLESLAYLAQGRHDRIPKIVSKLSDCGVHISVEEVARESGNGVPGRPHVANVMVRKGIVSGIQEAFDLYLGKGAPAYVKKTKTSPAEAMRVIRSAGGLPVLAHPHSIDEHNSSRLREIVRGFVTQGLEGLEVYYPKHTAEQTKSFLNLAHEFHLAVTGGTDFHGAGKPEIELGVIPGREPLPYSILQDMKARLNSKLGNGSL
jgi:predicted metal-dependent phosphoesterase TrpH